MEPRRSESRHATEGPDVGVGRQAAVIVSDQFTGGRGAEQLVGFFLDRGYAIDAPIHAAPGPPLRQALCTLFAKEAARLRFVVTVGGVGLRPSDTTPESTAPLLDFQTPAIVHAIFGHAAPTAPQAALNRGVAGVSGQTFVANFPESPSAVCDGLEALGRLLGHIQEQIEDVHGHSGRPNGTSALDAMASPAPRTRTSGPAASTE